MRERLTLGGASGRGAYHNGDPAGGDRDNGPRADGDAAGQRDAASSDGNDRSGAAARPADPYDRPTRGAGLPHL